MYFKRILLTPKDNFKSAIANDTIEHGNPINSHLWRGMVVFAFNDQCGFNALENDEILLDSVKALKTGLGHGSQAMKWVTSLADQHQINIMAFVAANDPRYKIRLS